MTADHLQDIDKFESGLWKIADNLRANSNLASNEYFMPIMGLIFLRHATNRFYEAKAAIDADKAAGKMPDRPLVEADFTRRRALSLPVNARFDVILETPKDGNFGAALTSAMEAVEAAFPPLKGQLPKDYGRFEDGILEEMMRMFDSEGLRTASGDVFGRIYEYFLAEFSKQGAHDNGEFFTPPSIVQTIVNVIEPNHGIVFDPACGSGGMFVQSSHFIEHEGGDTAKKVVFYGQEKNRDTIRIVGARFIVRTHVSGAFYNGNRHSVNGTVFLRNEAHRARNVNCDVKITFSAKHGTAWRKRTDHFRTHVGAHRARSIDWAVKLHDSSHRFRTMPTNQVTHCHTPSRR
jgi:type I restriction enzyme M protein